MSRPCWGLAGQPSRFSFAPFAQPALHPAQTAVIREGDEPVGLVGALHPRVRRELELPAPVFVFEIALSALSVRPDPGLRVRIALSLGTAGHRGRRG